MFRIRNPDADQWGLPVAASRPSTLHAWNAAMDDLLVLRGDPIGLLSSAIDDDPAFVLGRVVRIAALVLGGMPLDHPSLLGDLVALDGLADRTGERERGHLAAVTELATGNFSRAASAWEAVVDEWPRDLAAIRLAHDVYLHIGDDHARLASSRRALGSFAAAEPGHGLVLGQLAFALEELGAYDEALEAASAALAREPGDVWALHAAAHVHEMRSDSVASHALLDPALEWPTHELLAAHLWWHRGIRLVADDRIDEALAIADALPADPGAAFTLSDLTSLLVRLEQRGVDLGDRWDRVISAWHCVTARHTCGFLDLHAALAGLADPVFGADWQADQLSTHQPPTSQNDRLFVDVVAPLTAAVLALGGTDRRGARQRLAALSDDIIAIGGSRAQRQIIDVVAGVGVVPLPSRLETNQ